MVKGTSVGSSNHGGSSGMRRCEQRRNRAANRRGDRENASCMVSSSELRASARRHDGASEMMKLARSRERAGEKREIGGEVRWVWGLGLHEGGERD